MIKKQYPIWSIKLLRIDMVQNILSILMSILSLFHKVGAAYKNDRSKKLAAHVLLIVLAMKTILDPACANCCLLILSYQFT